MYEAKNSEKIEIFSKTKYMNSFLVVFVTLTYLVFEKFLQEVCFLYPPDIGRLKYTSVYFGPHHNEIAPYINYTPCVPIRHFENIQRQETLGTC